VKITPINFASVLEPELVDFWKDRANAKMGKVEVRRSHNFKLARISLSVLQVKRGNEEVLCHIDIVDIPQKEDHPALNAMLHLPDISQPKQLLMIFKRPDDPNAWSGRILKMFEFMLSEISATELAATHPELEESEQPDSESKSEKGDSEDTQLG